jgi:hypothetical protein
MTQEEIKIFLDKHVINKTESGDYVFTTVIDVNMPAESIEQSALGLTEFMQGLQVAITHCLCTVSQNVADTFTEILDEQTVPEDAEIQ